MLFGRLSETRKSCTAVRQDYNGRMHLKGLLKKGVFLLLFLAALLAGTTARAITIATVPVGDVGNANDPATGNIYGSVNYPYRIGTYEVTAGQYTAFLNAVAATDTYGLYDTANMGDFQWPQHHPQRYVGQLHV